jgi:hypothetical protein
VVEVVDVDVVVLDSVVEVTLDDVVVGIGVVLDVLLDVLVDEVLDDVVVGRGGQAPGASAFVALNFPGSSRVIVPPNDAQ